MLELALALAGLGLVAGVLTGAVAAVQRRRRLPAWKPLTCFGAALGLLAAIVSTRAGTMETVPLTLLAGVLIAGPGFAAGWWLAARLGQARGD